MSARAHSLEIIAMPPGQQCQRPRCAPDRGQQELDLQFLLRTGVPTVPRPKLRLVRSAEPPTIRRLGGESDGIHGAAVAEDMAGRQPTSTAELPDPAAWTARLAQAIIEVRSGLRPCHQLRRWICHDVMRQLRAAVPRAGAGRPERMHVSSVHIGHPGDGVVEACAVVVGPARSLAVALRLEGWDGRWICMSADVV